MKRSIHCCYVPVESHQLHVNIFFLSNFHIIVFNIYFLNIYTSPTFLFPLPFHLPITSPIFLPPLHFYLPTTLYINIIFSLSLHLPLFLSFLIHTLLLIICHYLFHSMHSFLSQKKKGFLSLSLSLSLTIFWWIFIFIFIFLTSLL